MNSFDFKGLPIAYRREGAGKPIVLLHNGGTSHTIWRDVITKLSETHEVFALDLLGYGASAKPVEGYTLQNYVEMLKAFISEHSLNSVTLIGNCMGSAISLAFARQAPDDVRALVLMNPLTKTTYLAGNIGGTDKLYRKFPALFSLLKRVRLPGWSAPFLYKQQFGASGLAKGLQHDASLRACHASTGQARSLFAIMDDIESYEELDRITADENLPPIFTIWGEENKILSVSAGIELNSKWRPQRQEIYSKCGHLLMLEKPSEVVASIEEFLSESLADVA